MDRLLLKAKLKRQRAIAVDFALEAGVLCSCRTHIDCLFKPAGLDARTVEPAIHARWNEEAAAAFSGRQELVAFVEQLLLENSRGNCSICAAIEAERAAQAEAGRVVYALSVEQHSATAERRRVS